MGHGYILSKPSVSPVADALSPAAAVFPALAAAVTPAAGVGQQANHVVAFLKRINAFS